MTRAIGYIRVSTERQAGTGFGMEAQREAITKCAAGLKVEVTQWFEDGGISGSEGLDNEDQLDLARRPGLLGAIESLGKGDVLLIANRTRLARDVILAAVLDRKVERRGARIVSAAGEGTNDNTPTSKLVRGIVDIVSEYQRAVTRMNTKAAVKAKLAQGLAHGHPPYGWSANASKRLQPQPDEQAVLARIRALRASGASWRAITETLNGEGVPSKLGGAWHPTQTRRAFARGA